MQKCYAIWKGIAKRENVEVLFHSERNNKKWKCRSGVPFGKEQQKVEVQKYCSIRKGTAKREKGTAKRVVEKEWQNDP